MAKNVSNLFIVGAGFSSNAGLPLTSEFTQRLLDVKHLKSIAHSSLHVAFLRKFVAETFQIELDALPENWPELEDIFTCIDLSANSGHHLGDNYSPSKLRVVRRALIVRIIRMLAAEYKGGVDHFGTAKGRMYHFFKALPKNDSAFLSMNWDTVIERGLNLAHDINGFDYGCEAIASQFGRGDPEIQRRLVKGRFPVLKPHGSVNWLYCDCCRKLFWFGAGRENSIASQLFKESDWDVVIDDINGQMPSQAKKIACPDCGAYALGTRFATFSYRKALEFPMHGMTWRSAERLLQDADHWVFIGYSLPPADYEFKLLLKRVLLSRRTKPRLTLITGGPGEAVSRTVGSYTKFFGNALDPESSVFVGGLNAAAIDGLEKAGILNVIARRKGLKRR